MENERYEEEERKNIFFYAEDDVRYYDVDADLNTPRYSLMHEVTFQVVEQSVKWLRGEKTAACEGGEFYFLDVGSGTGAESLRILEAYPESRLVAVDLCAPMHEVLRQKAEALLGERAVKDRVRFVVGDIANEKVEDQIQGALDSFGSSRRKFDLCISSLTLHHLTLEEKATTYRMLFRNLQESGAFINADLFGYQSPRVNELSQELLLDWIRDQHDPEKSDYPRNLEVLDDLASALRDKWLEHCSNFNRIFPADARLLDAGNVNPGDCELLHESGFQEISVPFRYWQSTVVWAQKLKSG